MKKVVCLPQEKAVKRRFILIFIHNEIILLFSMKK